MDSITEALAQTPDFVAAGDLHTGRIAPERLAALFEAAAAVPGVAFFAVPGDLTDSGSAEQYTLLRPYLARLPLPFYGVMGNHELHSGTDNAARARFCSAIGVEAPSYGRTCGGQNFLFLSSDGHLDGARVAIDRSICLLELELARGDGPLVVFCHAPLTGTVGGAPGRSCFLSDDPAFGLDRSDAVRALVRRSGRAVLWVCGHTHSPLQAEGLILTERLGDGLLHTVNLSSAYFTGSDFKYDDPLALYRFHFTNAEIEVRITDAQTGNLLREAALNLVIS